MIANLGLGILLLGLSACGSSGLQVQPPADPSPFERILTYQESLLALVASSATPAEAAARIAAWCAEHTRAIREAFAELEVADSDTFGDDYEARAQRLMERAELTLGPNQAFLEDEDVRDALEHCREPHDD